MDERRHRLGSSTLLWELSWILWKSSLTCANFFRYRQSHSNVLLKLHAESKSLSGSLIMTGSHSVWRNLTDLGTIEAMWLQYETWAVSRYTDPCLRSGLILSIQFCVLTSMNNRLWSFCTKSSRAGPIVTFDEVILRFLSDRLREWTSVSEFEVFCWIHFLRLFCDSFLKSISDFPFFRSQSSLLKHVWSIELRMFADDKFSYHLRSEFWSALRKKFRSKSWSVVFPCLFRSWTTETSLTKSESCWITSFALSRHFTCTFLLV